MNFFDKLKNGLKKTSDSFNQKIDSVLKAFKKVDEELFEELEEILISADIGVSTTLSIIDELRKRAKEKRILESEELKKELFEIVSEILNTNEQNDNINEKKVILIIGVNGVGKTTSIGKMASLFKSEGKSVVIAAADTFRAAAIDQLSVWADRAKAQLIKHSEGADPGAVVFDAISFFKSKNADVLICDTAGRLHNKKNLMNELSKINKIIERELPNVKKEVMLVLDATTGQNALSQAKLFYEATGITGIILTKLDGTAKGGIVIAIKKEQQIPVKYIGVGEGIDDLQRFEPQAFAKALISI